VTRVDWLLILKRCRTALAVGRKMKKRPMNPAKPYLMFWDPEGRRTWG